MGSEGNQAQPVKKTKNERIAESQLSDGSMPVIPVNRGKNHFTPNDVNVADNYDHTVNIEESPADKYMIFLPYGAMNPQLPVINVWDPSGGLPGGPGVGDRYISLGQGNGWFLNNIYQWDGFVWQQTVARLGMSAVLTVSGDLYLFDGDRWVIYEPTIAEKVIGDNAVFFSQNLNAIGLWFNRDSPKGKIFVRPYLVQRIGGSPDPPYDLIPFSDIVPIPVLGSDIDPKEELILRIPAIPILQNVGDVIGIGIIIETADTYDKNTPVYIGTQKFNDYDAQLWIINQQSMYVTAYARQIPFVPKIRLYPRMNRTIRVSDAEGNVMKPGAPIQATVEGDFVLSGENDYSHVIELDYNQYFGTIGLPTAGRLKRILLTPRLLDEKLDYNTFCIMITAQQTFIDPTSAPPGQEFSILNSELHIATFDLVMPFEVIARDDAPILVYNGTLLETVKKGMFVYETADPSNIGFVYRVLTELELVAGVLQPVSRVWAINITTTPETEMTFVAGTGYSFTLQPQPIVHLPPPVPPDNRDWFATMEWLVDIPYQTAIIAPAPGLIQLDYKLYAHIWGMGGDGDTLMEGNLKVFVEEDHRLINNNPARSLAGSESLEEKW